MAILREHLLEGEPISEVCQPHQLQPTVFYGWQKTFFENGAAAFERKKKRADEGKDRQIAALQEKLASKNEVIAELMEENVHSALGNQTPEAFEAAGLSPQPRRRQGKTS